MSDDSMRQSDAMAVKGIDVESISVPDDDRAADAAVAHHCAGLDHDPAVDVRRVVDVAVDRRLERLEHPAVRLEQRILAGVEPPAGQRVGDTLSGGR